jgi:phenylalanyl-tRNA synthetase beta chain
VRNLFIEVTGTDEKATNDILSVFATTLFDAGFKIKTVKVVRTSRYTIETPLLPTRELRISPTFVNEILGTDLSSKEIKKCLERSRIGAVISKNQILCTVPAYRIDISNPIDLAEEVAIGYGIYHITPSLPPSSTTGNLSTITHRIGDLRELLIGLGMLETLGFSLSNTQVLYEAFGVGTQDRVSLQVDASKSAEHEILRPSLVPSLLQALSGNIHEPYPQRLFEIGKIFPGPSTAEKWAVAAVSAHAEASYTEAKSAAEAMMRSAFGLELSTCPTDSTYFIQGRCAEILLDSTVIGIAGEISPAALEWFKIRTPVSGFEIDLSEVLEPKLATKKEI